MFLQKGEKLLQRPQQHQKWKENAWKHLPFAASKFIAEVKQKPRMSQCSSRASNNGVTLLALSAPSGQKNHYVKQTSACQEWPPRQISVSKGEKGVIVSLDRQLQHIVCCVSLPRVQDTADLLLSCGRGLLSIPLCSPGVCFVTLGNSAVPINYSLRMAAI